LNGFILKKSGMIFEYSLLFLTLSGIIVCLVYTFLTGISPVASSFLSRKKIIKAVPADQEGMIYELGAGWGTLAFPLARRCPQSTVVAYELSPLPWIFMKLRGFLCGPRNLKIVRRNFLQDDLSGASLVVCYLYPGAMAKLSSKLAMELKPDAGVISNTFEIPRWTPTSIQSLEDVMCPQIFHYKMENAVTGIHQFIDILAAIIV
jgi:hypothetical protein